MMNRVFSSLAMLLAFTGVSASANDAFDAISKAFAKVDSRISVVRVAPSAIEGLYEVDLDSGEVIYADATGKHLLVGNLLGVTETGLVNLTENRRQSQRAEALAALSEEDMVIFPAQGQKTATVHVFTDVDCFYCRKLHDEIKQINGLGIQVNYLAFPRQGIGSGAYSTMNKIWCADKAAQPSLMTKAKGGDNLSSMSAEGCVSQAVTDQYNLGRKMGVTGTPALLLPDGSLLAGYRPADKLAEILGVAQ